MHAFLTTSRTSQKRRVPVSGKAACTNSSFALPATGSSSTPGTAHSYDNSAFNLNHSTGNERHSLHLAGKEASANAGRHAHACHWFSCWTVKQSIGCSVKYCEACHVCMHWHRHVLACSSSHPSFPGGLTFSFARASPSQTIEGVFFFQPISQMSLNHLF